MEVIIHEERSFTFHPPLQGNYTTRQIIIPGVQVTKELLDGLRSAGLTPKVKLGQSITCMHAIVGFKAPAGPGPYEGSFELIGSAKFLRTLLGEKSRSLEEAKIKLEVTKIQATFTNIRADYSRGYADGHLDMTPTGQSPLFTSDQREAKRFEVTTTTTNWFDLWISNICTSTWTISVAVKLLLSDLSRIIGADPAVLDLLAVNRRMLTDEFLADTKVIAQNGVEIKFHRSILAAHSAAFERMFHTKMQEANTGVLELPDMSEESVRALKEYLYVWELKAPQEKSLVCFELFEAGHKYGINPLEKATSKILLSMGGAWYSALVGLRLFMFVKDMTLPRMKQKAVEVLKLKRAELKTLDEYRDLFRKENAAVAMELTECLASP